MSSECPLGKEVEWWSHLLFLLTSVKMFSGLSHDQSDDAIKSSSFVKGYYWQKFQVRAMKLEILRGVYTNRFGHAESEVAWRVNKTFIQMHESSALLRVRSNIQVTLHWNLLKMDKQISQNLFKKSSKKYTKLSIILEKRFFWFIYTKQIFLLLIF